MKKVNFVDPCQTKTASPIGSLEEGLNRNLPATISTTPDFSQDNVSQAKYVGSRPNDYRLGWLAWLISKKGRELAPMGVRVLGWMVLEAWQGKDRKMIVSHEELALQMETETKVIRATLDRLVAMKCLKVLIKGSCRKNQRRICSQYALGEAFEGKPPKMRGKNKSLHYLREGREERIPPIEQSPTGGVEIQTGEDRTPPITSTSMGGVQIHNRGEPTPPSPISTLNTHTKELPSALSKENWLKRGKDTYPDWDEGNMMGAFHNAEAKRVNGTWPSYQDKCYHLRKTSPKEAQKVASTYKDQRPKVVPSQPHRSQCESPRPPPIDYKNLRTVVDEIYTAFKEGLSIDLIRASATSALYEEAYKIAEAKFKEKGGIAREGGVVVIDVNAVIAQEVVL